MKPVRFMLVFVAAFGGAARSLDTPRTQTLRLNRPQRSQKEFATDVTAASVPLKVHGLQDLVYTVDVTIGSQQFNLTLDTIQAITVLFAKGIKTGYTGCDSAVAQRRLYDPRYEPF
ncbi:hypothetical protein AAVH_23318 [Aphelenchoides avenae]|nr:hypothetical protein AAVH_23318 [Aphelenchus avenae]